MSAAPAPASALLPTASGGVAVQPAASAPTPLASPVLAAASADASALSASSVATSAPSAATMSTRLGTRKHGLPSAILPPASGLSPTSDAKRARTGEHTPGGSLLSNAQ